MRRQQRRWTIPFMVLTLALTAQIALLGAGLSQAYAAQKLKIVTTTGMIGDAVRQVGGDRVNVTALMGPGIDPHAYRQTRSDIARLLRADLVLWHGLYLEAQMEEFFHNLAKKKNVIAIAETLPERFLVSHDTYKKRYDPHVWMNPELWSKVVTATKEVLIKHDPEGRVTYEANAEKHLADIAKLTAYSKKVISTVPKEQRVLVTAHDAFNYFGRAYGFEVLGIQGISTESEAGLRRVEDLVSKLVQRKISAVFIETSVADRNIKALIEGAAARDHKVMIGGELYSDAMGKQGTYEGTYIGMIDHNITTITRALGGQAPERGMSNRLHAGS
ncbi:MAG: metal ABC transporter solute-binding protein, Zn/Mn family [Methyloligellaceae bacterium]